MQNKIIHILSTRPVDEALVQQAKANGMVVDIMSFIETVALESESIKHVVMQLSKEPVVAIFTSMNAVNAVISKLKNSPASWKIFCMGNTTRLLVEKYFGVDAVIATAPDATRLADEIIKWKALLQQDDKVVFFCGDQRRHELPDQLEQHQINTEEIVVYKTIEKQYTTTNNYDGILFFSPSAVHSFFKMNSVESHTVFFAIGETTSNTIQAYTKNKIVISHTPSKDELLKQAIEWFFN